MKKYFILAAVAVALAACSNDENENSTVQNVDDAIRLTASVGKAVQTRAGNALMNSQFASDKTVMVKPTDKAGVKSYDPVVYTADGSGALTPATTQYYPAGGGAVDVYAYYPSDAVLTEDGYVVTLDQSTDAAYEAVDLMYATLSNINKTVTGTDHQLNFNHKLSKISVTLVKGTGIQDGELAVATVKLKDVVYKGTFAPATGTFTAASAATEGNKGDVIIATNAAQTAHSAIVVPQDVAGKKISVTIGNTTEEYEIPASTTFAAGTHYQYTITVAATGITATSSIVDWTSAGSATAGSVTF